MGGKSSKNGTRTVMIGLDGAGKTTILYRLKSDETVKTVPTVGFNIETVETQGIRLDVWDVGGQDKLRSLWRHYIQNTKIIVYVVDVADSERFSIACDELHALLGDGEMKEACLLIYGNKQDSPNAASEEVVVAALKLADLPNKWKYQPCIAIQGEGLFDGIDWIRDLVSPEQSGSRRCVVS
jgi:small GTP-binding protein